MGGGSLAEGRRQRAAEIAVIARNRKSKGVNTKDTKEIAKIAGIAKIG